MGTKVFHVSFDLEVADDANELSVKEAVTYAWDDEVAGHGEHSTRCGVQFIDVTNITVMLLAKRGK